MLLLLGPPLPPAELHWRTHVLISPVQVLSAGAASHKSHAKVKHAAQLNGACDGGTCGATARWQRTSSAAEKAVFCDGDLPAAAAGCCSKQLRAQLGGSGAVLCSAHDVLCQDLALSTSAWACAVQM